MVGSKNSCACNIFVVYNHIFVTFAGFVERMQAAKTGAKVDQIPGTSKFASSFEYAQFVCLMYFVHLKG